MPLGKLAAREGWTGVFVTHDPVASSYAYRVVSLVGGRVSGKLCAPFAAEVVARLTGMAGVPC
ncbi:hypothetical protein ACFWP5_07855 [Streptomyces sp. NPDC058469]|uniref:hypothetical protein n=1 Tax=Streptomyces sp. NPDC058469 TaxID=3346514 RepID=UPI00364CE8B9